MTDKVNARIGILFFKYRDPDVSVDTESRTVEQETIDDTIIVQKLGRRADNITINSVVADYETKYIDQLTDVGIVSLRTERWNGDIIVRSTTTDPMRGKDGDSNWLHNVTIEAIEVEEFNAHEEAINRSLQTNPP